MARACLAPETRFLALMGPLARTWRPVGWRVAPPPPARLRRRSARG
jgi:hypothetical protein